VHASKRSKILCSPLGISTLLLFQISIYETEYWNGSIPVIQIDCPLYFPHSVPDHLGYPTTRDNSVKSWSVRRAYLFSVFISAFGYHKKHISFRLGRYIVLKNLNIL